MILPPTTEPSGGGVASLEGVVGGAVAACAAKGGANPVIDGNSGGFVGV